MPSNRTVFVAMLGLCCAGCNPESFRAETRLLPDGSVERSVYQPLKRVPEDARQRREWAFNHRIHEMKWTSGLQLPIDDLIRHFDKPADDEKPNDYWFAKGKFTDINAIPNHLVIKAPEGMKDGRLVRQLERKDWGVVTEWTWNETLTDSFTFADHRKARIDAVEMAIPLIVAACAETWGSEYDLKPLERWLRGDAAASYQELCDIVLEWGLDKHKLSWESPVLLAKFDKVFQMQELHLFDAEHKPLKDEDAKRCLEEFVSKVLRQYVRDKKGEPLANEHLRNALSGPEESRLSQTLERVAHAKYGGEKRFQEHVNRLGIRMFGLYCWPPVFRTPQSFDYRMDVAGFVLETNATLIAERTLRWTFRSEDAFPLGYLMRATVAIPNIDVLAKHFPNAKLDTREIIVNYLDLVRADAQLKLALDDLIQKNDPTLWSAWLRANRNSKVNELLNPKPATKPDDTP